jgi:O-acetyl-ADP-ribose deacetylase (regulator of RNase III)
MAQIHICEGDLLDQQVEVIVNAWNRNIFPWWLLLPKGVSGAIKRRAGIAPFRELARVGLIPLGGAVVTTAGTLSFKAIIHVAGIGFFWCSSERAIRKSVCNALKLAAAKGYHSVAFPIIGSGTGGYATEKALAIMRQEIESSPFEGEVRIVRFTRQLQNHKS